MEEHWSKNQLEPATTTFQVFKAFRATDAARSGSLRSAYVREMPFTAICIWSLTLNLHFFL